MADADCVGYFLEIYLGYPYDTGGYEGTGEKEEERGEEGRHEQ